MKEEWVIRITGRVQGVGFRVFACRLAEQCGIAGTVKNLEDGSVEIVAQGAELDIFLNHLRHPSGRIAIEGIEIKKRAQLSPFDGFTALS